MTTTSKVYGVDMTQRIAAYEAVRQPAWDAYVAVQQPAWEAYEAVRQPAWDAYVAVQQPAWDAYVAVQQPAWEAYEAVRWSAREACDVVHRSAWAALACGDPLVDWIIANCAAHEVEALTILRALPADLDTLDAIAADGAWCSEWEALGYEAIRAGVISR